MRVLLRRGFFYLVTAWAAISLNFVLPRIMPGDPITHLIQQFRGKLSPEAIQSLRVLFGQPDLPLWRQYLDYWHNILTGNFGISYAYYPATVSDVIGSSIGWTLVLITICTVLAFVIGTALGILVGWKRGSWLDSLVPVTTFISAIPYFWFATVIVLFFAIILKWFPASGGYSVDQTIGFTWGFISSAAYYAILPALTIVVTAIAGWLIGMRNMMVTTLSEDYVRLAEAKGLPKRRVMVTYAARNAILPSFSSFAMSLGFVVSGSLVTEIVFNYPGIGSVLFKAAQGQDYPLMEALFLAITILVLVANILADIAYVFLDPRTRQEVLMAMNSTTLVDAELDASAVAGTARKRFAWIGGFRSPKVIVGVAIVVFFGILAIIGPMIAPFNPSQVSHAALQPPSVEHWLGTTQIGQDLLSQMLYGARISMFVGLGAAIIATALSVLVGLTAGYVGGLADDLLSLLSNVFLVLPGLPLAIILVALVPDSGSVSVIFVIAVTGWAWGARVLRAQTLSLRRRDFVEAARATGEKTGTIIVRDILPNQFAVIAASFLGTVTGAILTQASLAFLGLTAVTEWSWGTILYWAQASSAYLVGAWWWFVPAGLAIAVLGTGLSLINFGIDEFINPRLRLAGIGTKKAAKAQVKRLRAPASRRKTERVIRPVGEKYTPTSTDVILEVKNLKVDYLGADTTTPAVNNVSLTLRRGEVLGIAGESGSGKSTLAYAITRLHKPPAVISGGEMLYTKADGSKLDILSLSEKELREFRWDELSIVFQSAMNALNPILSIGTQIDDVLRAHRPMMRQAERAAKIAELFSIVGIQKDRVNAYPHELSGGMRQRAMIAIGLALDPEIIVMDEPTTALDVVIQRQIVEKIMELKDRLGFSVIFITHDISLLIELSDTIAIMYAGRIVEVATANDFYRNPRHPYSRGLLESFPTLSGLKRELTGIPGAPPDLRKLPTGCAFAPRCPLAFEACRTTVPPLFQLSGRADEQQAKAACLLYESDTDPGMATAGAGTDAGEERQS